jgi:4-hydroxybenzoate polyprenyltransferase
MKPDTNIKEYRTHPLVYLITTIIIFFLFDIYGSISLFGIIFIIYIFKYRADKEVMDHKTKKVWFIRAITNLILILISIIVLSFIK